MSGNVGWLTRYRRGERARVWHEVRQLGSRVKEPGFVDEAERVCDEMARRARHNVEVIVERLSGAGYRFHSDDDDQQTVVPFVAATGSAAAHARWSDGTVGPVPLTVLSWVRLVGDVRLVGTHPEAVGSAACDPLVVAIEGSRHPDAPMRDFLNEELAAWREQADDDDNPGLFALPVAPDRLHQQKVSGGLWYGVVVADVCADALFVGETTMPFVSYLNWVFALCGTHAGADRLPVQPVPRATGVRPAGSGWSSDQEGRSDSGGVFLVRHRLESRPSCLPMKSMNAMTSSGTALPR